MKTLLHLNTSLFSDGGQSSRLAEPFVAPSGGRRIRAAEVIVARPRRDAGAASHRRALPGVPRARPASAAPTQQAVVERLRRADRRAAARRRDRARPADVQLRRAVDAQGLLRPHRARRRDVPLHREGPGRPADRQEGVCLRDARRAATPARRATPRPAYVREFLGFLGMRGRRVRLRRRSRDRRGEEDRGAVPTPKRTIERLHSVERLAA